MRFQWMDKKTVNVEEKSSVIKWNFPTEPTIKVRRKMDDIPFATFDYINQSKYTAKSSMIAGLGAISLATINPQNGIFWETFMVYLFPWFLDIAQVFCAIKVAQAFYQENRGGRDSGTGIGAMVTYGKWLLLFHMIPFFVKLIDELGQRMAESIG